MLDGLGYRLVRVRVSGADGCTVQIMAERPDGTMTIEDCEAVSRALSPVLDVADRSTAPTGWNFLARHRPAAGAPLRLRARAGKVVKIEMAVPVDGRKRFRGGCSAPKGKSRASAATMRSAGETAEVMLPIEDMAEAKLVLTDELIAEALAAQQGGRARQQRVDDNPPTSNPHDAAQPVSARSPARTGPRAQHEGD